MQHLLQAAFQHSQSDRPALFPDIDLYQSLLERGYSVILRKSTRTCRVTDALLPGEDVVMMGAFPCRDLAIAFWFMQSFGSIGDADCKYELLHPYSENRYSDEAYCPVVGTVCDSNGSPVKFPSIVDAGRVAGFLQSGYVLASQPIGSTNLYFATETWEKQPSLAQVYSDLQAAFAEALAHQSKQPQIWQVMANETACQSVDFEDDIAF